jgi:hypothetical protein
MVNKLTPLTQDEIGQLKVGDRIMRISTRKLYIVTWIYLDGAKCARLLKNDRPFGPGNEVKPERYASG